MEVTEYESKSASNPHSMSSFMEAIDIVSTADRTYNEREKGDMKETVHVGELMKINGFLYLQDKRECRKS